MKMLTDSQSMSAIFRILTGGARDLTPSERVSRSLVSRKPQSTGVTACSLRPIPEVLSTYDEHSGAAARFSSSVDGAERPFGKESTVGGVAQSEPQSDCQLSSGIENLNTHDHCDCRSHWVVAFVIGAAFLPIVILVVVVVFNFFVKR